MGLCEVCLSCCSDVCQLSSWSDWVWVELVSGESGLHWWLQPSYWLVQTKAVLGDTGCYIYLPCSGTEVPDISRCVQVHQRPSAGDAQLQGSPPLTW